MKNNQEVGNWGEKKAESYLIHRGLKIVTKNMKNKYGEIDIIARDEEHLVFVEVKTRTNDSKGTPAEAVNSAKQAKIIQAAAFYLAEQNEFGKSAIRFDVISIEKIKNGFDIVHYVDAFRPKDDRFIF